MAKATLYWSLEVECPNCENENDIVLPHHDPTGVLRRYIIGNEWAKVVGTEITCRWCLTKFTVTEMEY